MEFTPIPSGSPQEMQAIQFLKSKLEEYGLHPKILRYDAYISIPKRALLEVLTPKCMEVKCTPYRQVGTTGPQGVEGDVMYIPPEEIGVAECKGKIVLAEQETTADWMGLRDGLLLRLEEMGVRGLIVIEQDSFMSNVVHQRADFSVSGNPTSDNVHLIQRIPAIVHVSNKDGQRLKTLVKQGGIRARIISIVETAWKTLPLLVAEIKSTQDPDKFLLVNSHIDTPPFSPGATDNASGDVTILELARILNCHREKLGRNIRFAYWTGHEIGRYAGSTWYNDAFWHELRYCCIGFLNIDSPGAEGAINYRAAPIGEVQDLAVESIKAATGIEVKGLRWPTRAGDSSFWGTGFPHASLTSARPEELYDPFVNYSGGGWWWHTPWATIDRGNIEILATDVKVNLNYIFRLTNCPVLPMNFIPYADALLEKLEDIQAKADKIRAYFNLDTVIKRAMEFRRLSEELEGTAKKVIKLEEPSEAIKELNRCYMWVSRHINLVAHWDTEKTEQVSMKTFGATPFPRIYGILKLADMPMPQAEEFKLLLTKLLRQRNFVEDGFYLANERIKETLVKIEKLLPYVPFSVE